VNKNILHLCADIGSDSYFYKVNGYNVIMIGENEDVRKYNPNFEVYGVIANPVCTEFSTANGFHIKNKPDMSLLEGCQRIIEKTNPKFWVIENPFNGTMKDYLGNPDFVYHPWEFGDPWTKKTALWGKFNKPEKIYKKWDYVPKNDKLYIRPGRSKPSIAFLHKSAINNIDSMLKFKPYIKNDADFRSICPQGFAKAFYEANP